MRKVEKKHCFSHQMGISVTKETILIQIMFGHKTYHCNNNVTVISSLQKTYVSNILAIISMAYLNKTLLALFSPSNCGRCFDTFLSGKALAPTEFSIYFYCLTERVLTADNLEIIANN